MRPEKRTCVFYSPENGTLVGMCFLNTQTLVQRDGVESPREALGGRGENAGGKGSRLGTYWLLDSTCCCSNCKSPGSTAQSPRAQRVCRTKPSSQAGSRTGLLLPLPQGQNSTDTPWLVAPPFIFKANKRHIYSTPSGSFCSWTRKKSST